MLLLCDFVNIKTAGRPCDHFRGESHQNLCSVSEDKGLRFTKHTLTAKYSPEMRN